MSPSAIDVEIRTLSALNDCDEMIMFLKALESRLQSKLDFELVQSYLNVFLKIHGEIVASNINLFKHLLQSIIGTHQQEWDKVQERMQYSLCMIDFVRLGFGVGGL
jgi:U3 small nucleolar RNA-associated protein 21